MPPTHERAGLRAVGELIWPAYCVGCQRPGSGLCGNCAPPGALRQARTPGVMTLAAAEYDGAVRLALLRYKERGHRELARPLGELLGRSLRGVAATGASSGPGGISSASPGPTLVVTVPSSRRASRQRGGDHVRRLARHARPASLGWVLAPPDRHRLTRSVADSAGLDRGERQRNLALAMAATAPPWPLARTVLVDDIATSGATIAEARRALTAAGWDVLGAAVVALTRPRRGDRTQSRDDVAPISGQYRPDTSRSESPSRVRARQTP